MRAAVTGGAGFIGRSVVRQLRGRGDAVVALVRDAGRAGTLRELGCEVVEVDLATAPTGMLQAAMEGADAVFHAAGSYRVINTPEMGANLVHVEDAAAGIILVHDRGRIGEEYVLGGEIATLREVVRGAAAVAGKRPPWLTTPSWLLHAVTPLGWLIGRPLAGEPNLREMVRASDQVTYWATDARARVELGYAPRDLEAGLPTLLASR